MFDIDKLKYGLYVYRVGKKIIYVGYSKNIQSDNRYHAHLKMCNYNVSPLNKYLQDNENWEYEVVAVYNKKWLAIMNEGMLIKKLKPIFNVKHNSYKK